MCMSHRRHSLTCAHQCCLFPIFCEMKKCMLRQEFPPIMHPERRGLSQVELNFKTLPLLLFCIFCAFPDVDSANVSGFPVVLNGSSALCTYPRVSSLTGDLTLQALATRGSILQIEALSEGINNLTVSIFYLMHNTAHTVELDAHYNQ